ncbi:MAG: transglycosylase SLT domain-containing protein [Actinobacteria bacterium]|uniref:Unannotated protein n=1 Tax=freshwater metagenome TaxID=449393 RepID=A0A6J6S8M2_9ZZZZ|nr:transglycosylase SLT domain-containing protein [Actinomycetota bacterium]
MSVTEITSRISQIQAQLALLAPASTGATAFASQLDAASYSSTGARTATAGTTGTTGEDVVTEAKKYLGVPYVWGGTDPAKGLDCSGLVQLVYDNLGVDLPRVSYQQATAGTPVDGLANAQPGDVLAFGSPVHHVGIYVGDNQMIEAPRPGLDVRIAEITETPTAIRRMLPETSAVSATAATTTSSVAGVPYAKLFNEASQKYGVDPVLLAAVARQESGYDPSAVSGAGAQGLMQLMPGTAAGLGVDNPFDPAQSVDGAARLLRDLLDRFGRVDYALAGYNAGPGAVLRYDGIPPYPETQKYVRSVLAIVEAA